MINFFKKIRSVNIIRNSSNYFLGNIATSSIAFFSIPIFTNLLSPADYGNVNLFTAFFAVFTIVFSLGFEAAVSNKFLKDKTEFDFFLGTILIFLFFVQLLILGILFFMQEFLSSLLNIDGEILRLACYAGILMTAYKIYQSVMKSSLQSMKFVFFAILFAVLSVGFSIIFIVNLEEKKYIGRIYGYIIAISVSSFISFFFLLKTAKLRFKKKHLLYALSFSLPFLPHLASQLILSLSDRIIINQLTGPANTGLYSFAYNIGTIMLAVIGAVMSAFVPDFYNYIKTGDYSSLNKKVQLISSFIFLAALFFILFGKEIIMLMSNEKYYEALSILPWIIIGYVFFYFYSIYSIYATYEGKTGFFSLITLFVGVINVILNYTLIPVYGYKVAAITTLISYAMLFFFHYCYAKIILKKTVIPLRINLNSAFIFILSILIWLFFYDKIENYIIKFILKTLHLTLFFIYLFRSLLLRYLKGKCSFFK